MDVLFSEGQGHVFFPSWSFSGYIPSNINGINIKTLLKLPLQSSASVAYGKIDILCTYNTDPTVTSCI